MTLILTFYLAFCLTFSSLGEVDKREVEGRGRVPRSSTNPQRQVPLQDSQHCFIWDEVFCATDAQLTLQFISCHLAPVVGACLIRQIESCKNMSKTDVCAKTGRNRSGLHSSWRNEKQACPGRCMLRPETSQQDEGSKPSRSHVIHSTKPAKHPALLSACWCWDISM